jgi:hypothetical protein
VSHLEAYVVAEVVDGVRQMVPSGMEERIHGVAAVERLRKTRE